MLLTDERFGWWGGEGFFFFLFEYFFLAPSCWAHGVVWKKQITATGLESFYHHLGRLLVVLRPLSNPPTILGTL